MNKTLLIGMLMAVPSTMMAQSALDAYSISQNDLRGSARFMSMGGAFTALGGDISTSTVIRAVSVSIAAVTSRPLSTSR